MSTGNSGTYITTPTFSELVDLVRTDFKFQSDLVEERARQLFKVENIPANSGNSRRYQEYDMDTFADEKPEGVAVSKGTFGIGYSKTMYVKRIGKEIDITFEMQNYDRYKIAPSVKSLAHYCPQRIELDLTHTFTFAGATSYVDKNGQTVDTTTGDDLALCSTSHTLPHSSTTWSNRLATDPIYSPSALVDAEDLGNTQIYNQFGEKRVMSFRFIVTADTQSVVDSVEQTLVSKADIDTNNSGISNMKKGKYTHIILPYMATTATGARDANKRNYWFLVSDMWQAYLGIWESPHMSKAYENESTDVSTFGTRAGFGKVTPSAKGVIGSLNAS